MDKVAAELKTIQDLIREIKETEAPTDLAVAIRLVGMFDGEPYRLAIFFLERESDLTFELALETLKSVEQSLRDREETG